MLSRQFSSAEGLHLVPLFDNILLFLIGMTLDPAVRLAPAAGFLFPWCRLEGLYREALVRVFTEKPQAFRLRLAPVGGIAAASLLDDMTDAFAAVIEGEAMITGHHRLP